MAQKTSWSQGLLQIPFLACLPYNPPQTQSHALLIPSPTPQPQHTLAQSRYSNIFVDLKPQTPIGLNQYYSFQGIEREKEPPAGILAHSAWP